MGFSGIFSKSSFAKRRNTTVFSSTHRQDELTGRADGFTWIEVKESEG